MTREDFTSANHCTLNNYVFYFLSTNVINIANTMHTKRKHTKNIKNGTGAKNSIGIHTITAIIANIKLPKNFILAHPFC